MFNITIFSYELIAHHVGLRKLTHLTFKERIMAIVKGKFVVGKIGPVVYRRHRGQQVISGKPEAEQKLTEGTKKSAKVFGKSSTFASQIRLNITQVVTSNYDGSMNYRLTQEVVNILNKGLDPETSDFYFNPSSFDQLSNFQFNSNSPFNRSLSVDPYITVTDNQLTLHLPEIKVPKDLKFPLKANSCNINFTVIEFNLLKGTKRRSLIGSTTINNAKGLYAAQEWTAPLQEGWFCVIAMSLNYVEHSFAGNVVLNSKSFCPAMIIKAGFITNIAKVGPFKLTTNTYQWASNK
jgi:hypothetical protein